MVAAAVAAALATAANKRKANKAAAMVENFMVIGSGLEAVLAVVKEEIAARRVDVVGGRRGKRTVLKIVTRLSEVVLTIVTMQNLTYASCMFVGILQYVRTYVAS